MHDIRTTLEDLLHSRNLTVEQMKQCVRQIMTVQPVQLDEAVLAAFLIALRMKGETVEEIQGGVEILRELMQPVELGAFKEKAIDIVGTGGDGARLFNISTASSLVVASAGGYVAKHGSKAFSSSSGSADVLAQAGAVMHTDTQSLCSLLEQTGFCFMFAPAHHGAMKHTVSVRQKLGQRTIFNLLGPLSNPASVTRHMVGCFDARWLTPLAQVLQRLGSTRIAVIHSHDGLDEISLAAPTDVVEIRDGKMRKYAVKPQDASIKPRSWKPCVVSSSAESYQRIVEAFTGKDADAADLIALNAGLALQIAGIEDNYRNAVANAREHIADGSAMHTLTHYVNATKTRKNTQQEKA